MLLGYNTNGFAHHTLEDALEILARLGYRSVAITLDHYVLNPYSLQTPARLPVVRELLRRLALVVVVETGARFLLDPWHKHQPTLLSASAQDRERRLDFLRRSIDVAHAIGAEIISFWSGSPAEGEADEVLMKRLAQGCLELCSYAAPRGIRLAFEPEPGMFIDTMDRYAELFQRVGHPAFGLTLDIGHLYCLGENPVGPHLRKWSRRLWNIHIEDMRRGIHDHLMFGEGEIDFKEVLIALTDIDYRGPIHVELSRHSHDAVETARRALAFLKAAYP
jgi:sugar phosphate isomerase/epimerase